MVTAEQLRDKIQLEFDHIPQGSLTVDSDFKEAIRWSSMNSVILITMVELEFGVLLTPQELKEARTITELCELIQSKKAHG